MTDKTNKERQARFYSRQKEAGLVKVSVWVPRDMVGELRRLVAEMLRRA